MKNFVLFRYPHETDIHLLAADSLVKLDKIQLKDITGFVLRPFDTTAPPILIPDEHKKINPSEDTLQSLKFHFLEESPYNSTSKEEYTHYVDACVSAITKGEFDKVVPAKLRLTEKDVNPLDSFQNACDAYPNSFISLSSTEVTGTWMGATPEVLLTIDQENTINTVALAGTQESNGKLPSEAVWTQKEIEEQALVSRYIINCFKKIRLREFEEIGPKTIKAGNLLHLKTAYKIKGDELDYEDLGSTLLDLLHPTSAVCGMPKEAATAFIKKHEQFNRELYAGFIGPVNYQQRTAFFVNLRCIKIGKGFLHFYAGAGVTEDSIAEREWIETEKKCAIMESIL